MKMRELLPPKVGPFTFSFKKWRGHGQSRCPEVQVVDSVSS